MEEGLKAQPNNLFLLRERLAAAVQRGDRHAVDEVVTRLQAFRPEWNEDGRDAFAKFLKALEGPWPLSDDSLNLSLQFANTLPSQPGYQRDIDAVVPSAGLTGVPVAQFLRLAPIPVEAAAPI